MYSAADVPFPDTSAMRMPTRWLVERQEVVVVAANFPRRDTQRRRRQARHRQRPLRQQRHLDFVRDPELLFEPFLFVRLPQQVLDAGGHLVERSGQLAELILGGDRNLVREVALPHALGAGKQLVDGAGDRSRERRPDDERHDFDHEEQPADHDQQDEQQRLPERAIADHALRGGQPAVDLLNIQLRRDEQRARRSPVVQSR